MSSFKEEVTRMEGGRRQFTWGQLHSMMREKRSMDLSMHINVVIKSVNLLLIINLIGVL